jgi:hypothetical protein
MQVMSGDRAAAYLSSYFVRGKGSKATLQDNRAQPTSPADADLGFAEADTVDGRDDAGSRSVPSAVGSSRGPPASPVVVGCRARSGRLSGWPVARPRAVSLRWRLVPSR